MIEVKYIKDSEYEITWDENDPIESQLNTWTEEDFLNCIKEQLEERKKNKLEQGLLFFQMSYEEFLDLPVNYITQFAQNIKYKRENNIPFSEEDLQLQKYFIRYTQDLQLQEEKARLEYFYSLDAYEK